MVEKFDSRNVEIKEKSSEEKALDRIAKVRDRVDDLFRSQFHYKKNGHECWLSSSTFYISFFERYKERDTREKTVEYFGKERGFELVERDGDNKVTKRETLPMERVNEEIDNFEKELEKWELQKLQSEVKK